MTEVESLEDKCHRVYVALTKNGYPKWLMGVGQGKEDIVVYVDKKKNAPPEIIDGILVKIEVIGQIRLC